MNRKLLKYGSVRIIGLLFLLMMTLQTNAQFITIGTGTTNTDGTGADPVDDYYNGMHYQTVYTATELSNAGLTAGSSLTSLGFDVSQSPGTLTNYTIKLAHTSQADAATYVDPATTAFTTVVAPFNYTPTVTTAGSFDMIPFTTNFIWDGTSNVVVDICTTPGNPFGTPYGGVRVSSSTNGASFIRGDAPNDQGICSQATGGFDPTFTYSVGVLSDKPNVRFNYIPGTACSGTPVAGVAAASAPVAGGAVCPNTTFTLSTTGATAASGLTYDWQFDNGSGWTPTGGTSPNYVVTGGINVATSYRLVIGCGSNYDTTNAVSLTVNPFYNCYCTPASNCTNEGIVNVTFDVLNNSSVYCGTGYENYGALGALVTVTQAQVLPITVSARVNDVGGNHAGVWIDYDHSGTFDANEYTSLGNTGSIVPPDTFAFTGNIIVPATALTGITRMRVRSANNSGITSTSACNTGTVYGEYEDYLININAGSICGSQPSAGTITGPSSVCTGGGFTLNASGFTSGVTGLTYEWHVYDNVTSSWIPAPGVNNDISYTNTMGVFTPTDYRFTITCTNGGQQDFTTYTVTPSVVTIFPFTEDFESGSPTLSCWKVVNANADGDTWTFTSSTTYAHSGSIKAQIYTDFNAGANDDWLISPAINLTGNQELKYWYRARTTGEPNDYTILLSTTGNSPADFTTVLKPLTAVSNTTYLKDSIDLSAFSGTVFIAFQVPPGGLDGYYLYIDDVSVEDIPAACSGQPDPVTIAGPTAACSGVDFTLTATGYSFNPGISWEWQVYNTGTSSWDPAPGTNNTPSYTVAGGITVPTDYRFVTTCINGGLQDVTNPWSMTMHPFYNCYCIPVSNCTNEGIDSVGFDLLSNVSGFCASGGYTDYGSLGSLATVTQAQVIPMVVKGNVNSNPASAGVWIDYDHSGTFDASEYTSLGSSSGLTPLPQKYYFTGNVVIDANALTGITRMRVRTANQSGITAASACNTGTVYGEYEDYLITINAGNFCTGLPVAGTSAASVLSVACTGSPFVLSATGHTTGVTGLTFQWQESSDGISFTDIGPATAGYAPYTVPGISATTHYRLQVTCSQGGGQDWTQNATSVVFSTPPIPWTEGFESLTTTGANIFPACWTRELLTGTNSPGTTTTNDIRRSPRNGTSYLYTMYNTTAWVFTPAFDLQAGTSYDFSFYMMNKSVTTPVNFTMDVAYGTSATATAMTNVLQAGYVPSNSAYQLFKYTFTPSVTGTYNFGINSASPNTTPWYLSFDDFALEVTPSCSAPVLAIPTNITASSADISWAPVTGGAGYEYVLDQSATAPSVAGTPFSGTTYNATGLSPNTLYYFHARTACASSFSSWSTISFTTGPQNDFCSGAVVIPTAGPYTTAAYSNVNANDVSDPAITCQANSHKGIWFSFIPPTTGSYTISTCQSVAPLSDITDNTLGVFTSAAGCTGPFTEVVCDDDNCGTLANQAVATTTLTQGVEYFIVVYGYNTNSGNVQVNISGTPLTVRLADITATNVGSRHRVDWTTASEDLGDYFEVERSADGNDFTTLGTVQANATGSAYSFWDERPYSGTSYYRLKMMDAAGTATYSKVVSATLKGNGFAVHAFPNPATDKVTVTVSGATGNNQTIILTDVTGKTIKAVSVVSGTAQIDMTTLASGIYLIKYMDSNNNETIKINKR